ncbi:MAG: hypothetical protein HYV35_03350 [Lentisphaerae bacterium]|nr:hypothetical protein [Lentisphaerota bacterium]
MKLSKINSHFGVKRSLAIGVLLAGLGIFPSAAEIIVETTTWSKYDNNIPGVSDTTSTNGRIGLGIAGKGDDVGLFTPAVIGGPTNQMWYTATDGGYYRIYYATSPDGLTWTKYDNTTPTDSDTVSTNGRIPRGTAGKGDDTYAAYATVIKDGTTYKMWYSGYQDATTARIYYATSPDGLTWTKYSNSIPTNTDTTSTDGRIGLGSPGNGDTVDVFYPTVIKDGAVYKMWYTGYNGTNNRIYYATSPDGLTWTKYNNAIPTNSNTTSTDGRIPLGTAGKGDQTSAYIPVVIKVGNTYKMWYGGYDGANARIYYATSPDGLTWTKHNNTTPADSNTTSTDGRVPRGTLGDLTHSLAPAVIRVGNTYKMWYGGYSGAWRIYHAVANPPASTIISAW